MRTLANSERKDQIVHVSSEPLKGEIGERVREKKDGTC